MVKLLAGVVIGLTLFGLGINTPNFLPQENPNPRRQTARTRREEERRRARDILVGRGTGRSLREAARTGTGTSYGRREVSYQFVDVNPPSLPTLLNALVRDADAVIIATVTNATGRLTDDETLIFTEYQMNIEEVLKDNPASPIQVNSTITVARGGGTIRINNRDFVFEDRNFKPFVVGSRYLLFLQHIPERSIYVASSHEGSFLLVNNQVFTLTHRDLPPALTNVRDTETLIESIRIAVSASCDTEVESANE